MRNSDPDPSSMIRTNLVLCLFLSIFTGSMFAGCSAFQSPNSNLGTPGANAVTDGKWRLEARGRFINGNNSEIKIDLVIQQVGDPTKTVATPAMVTVVGEDAVITMAGNGADVVCSVSTVREDSRAIVTVSSVISQGGSPVARPMLRFGIDG